MFLVLALGLLNTVTGQGRLYNAPICLWLYNIIVIVSHCMGGITGVDRRNIHCEDLYSIILDQFVQMPGAQLLFCRTRRIVEQREWLS